MMKHSTPLTKLLSQQFFEAASDAVVIIEESGVIVHINSQAEMLFGYGRKELLDQPMEILVPERLRVRHVEHRRDYFRNPLPRAMGSKLVAIGLRKDGTEFPIDLALSPLPTELGFYVAAAVRDITDQRQLENELRQQARDLANADLHKDHFLVTLAHEMRSPLAAIAYSAEYLRRGEISVEDRNKAAGIVLEGANLVRQMLNDLSELPRIERGELPVHKAPADLVEVARLAIEMSRPLIERQGHVLEIIMPSMPLRILGDVTRLAQIITNLLTNAARYTPTGGRISLTLEQQAHTIVLKVKDNGIGIPPEMLTRVFDLFTRLDAAKQRYTSGLGIGLAYVRRLVEVHGGSVHAFSEGEERGSEFVVLLPLAEVQSPTGSADCGNHPTLSEKVPLGPLRDQV